MTQPPSIDHEIDPDDVGGAQLPENAADWPAILARTLPQPTDDDILDDPDDDSMIGVPWI